MGKTKTFQPFTKRDFDQLKAAERRLTDILPLLDKAENCGMECQQFREVVQEFLKRFNLLEREFMSPPPTK